MKSTAKLRLVNDTPAELPGMVRRTDKEAGTYTFNHRGILVDARTGKPRIAA